MARAEGLGIPALSVDGNDVGAVDAASADLVARLRAGEGPMFLHARTYRLKGHTTADPDLYRDAADVAAHAARDPIKRARGALAGLGLAQPEIAAVEAEAEAEMEAAFEAAKAAAWPAPESGFTDVQDTGAGQWR